MKLIYYYYFIFFIFYYSFITLSFLTYFKNLKLYTLIFIYNFNYNFYFVFIYKIRLINYLTFKFVERKGIFKFNL